ncbi:ParA family protein [Pseudomonas putida]|uniref:AAA domain-containing protein n=1 Tax=Pseudomonas putida TaxID=303 RepID=A0A177SVB6_PSEPU|nr:ParA family protein [Pseudomonas putida]OAI94895.1 hypothetical protein AYO28_07440 [Pseudomonas putida]
MSALLIMSTKGGVGKTSTAANLGGIAADAGLRVLLIDLDIQPTLSSYFPLTKRAPCGTYELLALNERDVFKLVSKTSVRNLDLIISNDPLGQLHTLLVHAPDGRMRLRNLMPIFKADYDLVLIDTQGARSVVLEMALLATDRVLSPVAPEILAARELHRGTVQLMSELNSYRRQGITLPTLEILLNRVHPTSRDARQIQAALREVFEQEMGFSVLNTIIPALNAYPVSASNQTPAHRHERRRPWGRKSPAALETFRELGMELFPNWAEKFRTVDGKRGE